MLFSLVVLAIVGLFFGHVCFCNTHSDRGANLFLWFLFAVGAICVFYSVHGIGHFVADAGISLENLEIAATNQNVWFLRAGVFFSAFSVRGLFSQ